MSIVHLWGWRPKLLPSCNSICTSVCHSVHRGTCVVKEVYVWGREACMVKGTCVAGGGGMCGEGGMHGQGGHAWRKLVKKASNDLGKIQLPFTPSHNMTWTIYRLQTAWSRITHPIVLWSQTLCSPLLAAKCSEKVQRKLRRYILILSAIVPCLIFSIQD